MKHQGDIVEGTVLTAVGMHPCSDLEAPEEEVSVLRVVVLR
jgi:hypothetical protein